VLWLSFVFFAPNLDVYILYITVAVQSLSFIRGRLSFFAKEKNVLAHDFSFDGKFVASKGCLVNGICLTIVSCAWDCNLQLRELGRVGCFR